MSHAPHAAHVFRDYVCRRAARRDTRFPTRWFSGRCPCYSINLDYSKSSATWHTKPQKMSDPTRMYIGARPQRKSCKAHDQFELYRVLRDLHVQSVDEVHRLWEAYVQIEHACEMFYLKNLETLYDAAEPDEQPNILAQADLEDQWPTSVAGFIEAIQIAHRYLHVQCIESV
jgi:hypothetical protein